MMTPRPTPPTLLTLGLVIGAAWLSGGCIETGIRPGDLEEVVSGNPAPVEDPLVVDRVVQVTQPQVDVLFVIDNSGSMRAHQDNLSANFPAFMRTFDGSGLDFHVGVTSTDTNVTGGRCDEDPAALNGRLNSAMGHRWIDETTLNPVGVFQSLATLGTNGSGCERGLAATYRAREEQIDANAGFFRDGAPLHTVVVSDEQDQTDEENPEVITLNEFINWYDGLGDAVEDRTFSSVVCQYEGTGESGNTCYRQNLGTRYLQVTDAIGGLDWDILDEDFGVLLDNIGLLAAGLKTEYFLSQVPVPETIEVSIEEPGGAVRFLTQGAAGTGADYAFDEVRNAIVMHTEVPEPLETVVIAYVPKSASQDPEIYLEEEL